MKYRKSYGFSVRGVITRSGSRMFEITDGDAFGYVDVIDYARNANETFAELARQNIILLGPRRARVVELIGEIEDFEPTSLFDRVGKNGSCFAYPDGTVFTPEGEPQADVIFPLRPDKCHQAGSLEGWWAELAGPLAGHPICEFAMGVGLAATLRSFTTRPLNFGIELVGPPATSKTVLLELVASMCGGTGGGDAGDYTLSFAATPAGLESEMQHYSDLPMIIDEGNLFELGASAVARGKAFMQLLMAFGKGQEKRRFHTMARVFRFTFLTSCNESLLQIAGGTAAQSVFEASADRLMTILLDGREFGVFEHLPSGYEDVGDFIADLMNAAAEHHGHAMRHFLQGMVTLVARDPAAFSRRLEERITEFRQHACIEANASRARRIADNFGLIYAAMCLGQRLGTLPATYDPLGSTMTCYRLHRAAYQPQPAAAAILIGLADDPDVIDLDRRRLPFLSKEDFAETKAFKKTNPQGVLEVLIPPASVRALIANWNVVRRDDLDVARLLRREKGHHTVKRQVRRNAKSDRLVCVRVGRKKK